jgi:L-rhamnose-H+ transport protein
LRVPLVRNWLFCALAGTTWYMQFFFYQMGESQMGNYRFSSWTLHMASIIIFSTLWGIFFREWRGVSSRTRWMVGLMLVMLVGSTAIIGWGNYISSTGVTP